MSLNLLFIFKKHLHSSFLAFNYIQCWESELIHFQEAYASLLSVPLATSGLIIHFEEVSVCIFSIPLPTYSVGESEVIQFQEVYARLFSVALAT